MMQYFFLLENCLDAIIKVLKMTAEINVSDKNVKKQIIGNLEQKQVFLE